MSLLGIDIGGTKVSAARSWIRPSILGNGGLSAYAQSPMMHKAQ